MCNKMEVQVICDRSMQLAAGMCLEGQCVNAIPQELRWRMALIYSNSNFYFFLTHGVAASKGKFPYCLSPCIFYVLN